MQALQHWNQPAQFLGFANTRGAGTSGLGADVDDIRALFFQLDSAGEGAMSLSATVLPLSVSGSAKGGAAVPSGNMRDCRAMIYDKPGMSQMSTRIAFSLLALVAAASTPAASTAAMPGNC